jgi:hypothetical protein
MSSIIGGFFNLVGTLIKYGFYTIVLSSGAVLFIAYKTIPDDKTLNLGILHKINILDDSSRIQNWVFFKIATYKNTITIGAFNNWVALKS